MAYNYFKGVRWLPVIASVANLAAFIVALKLLLVAVAGRDSLENAAIITAS